MSYIKPVIITATLSLMFSVAANFVLNPFGVFNAKTNDGDLWTNFSYNKIEYLSANIDKHTGLILGSSRMGLYSTELISKLTGTNYYNYSLLGVHHKETLSHLKQYIYMGGKLEEVFIGIDIYSFTSPPETSEAVVHPSIGNNDISFWGKHLFSPAVKRWMGSIRSIIRDEWPIQYNWDAGEYRLIGYEREIAADHQSFLKKFDKPVQVNSFTVTIKPQRLADYNELTHWLRENNVKVTAFIHPINHLHRAVYPDGFIEKYVRMVKDNSYFEVKSFSDNTCISNDDTVWYEGKHYRPELAKEITRALLNDTYLSTSTGCNLQPI